MRVTNRALCSDAYSDCLRSRFRDASSADSTILNAWSCLCLSSARFSSMLDLSILPTHYSSLSLSFPPEYACFLCLSLSLSLSLLAIRYSCTLAGRLTDNYVAGCLLPQDLTYAEGGHNWRSIIFSLLVIGFVIAGIVTAIYLLG